MTNETILNKFKDMDDLEVYQALLNYSDINIPIEEFNIDQNEIKQCVSKMWQFNNYLYSNSRIVNGVCYLITILILDGIKPTFHHSLNLSKVDGFDVAIKNMMK